MADELKDSVDAALGIFKDALKGFVENEKVVEFGKEHIKAYAEEAWAAKKASSPEEKAEHEANLRHLIAQARVEARRLQIAISEEAKDTVGRVLETVGNMILKFGPKILAGLL